MVSNLQQVLRWVQLSHQELVPTLALGFLTLEPPQVCRDTLEPLIPTLLDLSTLATELLDPSIWVTTPLVRNIWATELRVRNTWATALPAPSTAPSKPGHTTAQARIMDLSTDHCTVLSTGAATVSPRLGSLLQEPPTHPHITLQMQTSPTILDSTCGEEVETGRTQDTPKATQAMIGAIRSKGLQDQAIQTPGPPTLNQGPQTGGERIGWAHQGHLGTSD